MATETVGTSIQLTLLREGPVFLSGGLVLQCGSIHAIGYSVTVGTDPERLSNMFI